MAKRRNDRNLVLYVGGVVVAGIATLIGVLIANRGLADTELGTYAMLTAIIVIGELFPVTVTFRNEKQDVTTSTTFVFAVLLMFGPAAALVSQALASITSDVIGRKVWWKAAFNVSQYTISWAVAALVFTVSETRAGDFEHAADFAGSSLPFIILSAIAFFLVNSFLIGAAVALAQDLPVLRNLRHHIGFYAWSSTVLFSLSPIVVVVATQDPLLVPLLLAPIGAAYYSAQVSMEKEHQAAHDPLTDLPNRAYFRERVTQAVAEHPERALAVLIIDLDHFKEVNDTLGHQIGDQLLQDIGRRLRGAIRTDDMVARLGGDEFAVLARVHGSETPRAVASSIHTALEAPFELGDLTFEIGASIGAALYPEHGDDVGSLIRKADVAMYAAKEQRGGYEPYEPERDRHDARRLTLLSELRHAIEAHHLVLHYQPKADLATGRVLGVEALVRWQHEEHGLLPPDDFIPLAEPTGLIGPLTLAVLTEALRQCRVWEDAGLDLRVAVNVSVRNLYDERFVHDVDRLLRRFGVAPGNLTLEITESTMMADPTRPVAALSQLSMRGVHLSIDDFGTGYSSLAYLKRLPVTEIKIDKSFVLGMIDDADDATIVRSTIELARNLGLQVVAEGVEHEDVWQTLAAQGCHRAQGFYLSPALPAGEFEAWLEKYEGRITDPAERATLKVV
ncbi:MAG: EAL domain-containing protein [Acidimicrobiia bacterium]